MFNRIEGWVISFGAKWGIPLLRVSLGIVYLWFGALKVAAVSPVSGLIGNLYPWLPEPGFVIFLGVWEMVIGAGLLFNKFMRATLVLLWLQMGGIMIGPFIKCALFMTGCNPFLLNVEGEFVVKNLVIIAASLVLAGQLKPRNGSAS